MRAMDTRARVKAIADDTIAMMAEHVSMIMTPETRIALRYNGMRDVEELVDSLADQNRRLHTDLADCALPERLGR